MASANSAPPIPPRIGARSTRDELVTIMVADSVCKVVMIVVEDAVAAVFAVGSTTIVLVPALVLVVLVVVVVVVLVAAVVVVVTVVGGDAGHRPVPGFSHRQMALELVVQFCARNPKSDSNMKTVAYSPSNRLDRLEFAKCCEANERGKDNTANKSAHHSVNIVALVNAGIGPSKLLLLMYLWGVAFVSKHSGWARAAHNVFSLVSNEMLVGIVPEIKLSDNELSANVSKRAQSTTTPRHLTAPASLSKDRSRMEFAP